jgi:hypothetical protein
VPLRESEFEVDIPTDAREQQVLIFHHLIQPLSPLVAVVLSDAMDNADEVSRHGEAFGMGTVFIAPRAS